MNEGQENTTKFHRDNLANREHIEHALSGGIFGWDVVSSVASILCNTLSSRDDLLYADRAIKIFTLIGGGKEIMLELVIPRPVRTKHDLRVSDRFRLTQLGRERLGLAIQKPFVSVEQVVLETHYDVIEKPNIPEIVITSILRESVQKEVTSYDNTTINSLNNTLENSVSDEELNNLAKIIALEKINQDSQEN